MTLIMNKQLAWELADQLGADMSDEERTAVFVTLGSGDHTAAIHRLINIATKCRHSLPIGTAKRFHAWAHAHHLQDRYAQILARIEAACITEAGLMHEARDGVRATDL
ncbi:hypothetical protein HZU40_11490 [Mycolicibacterium fluoranthenivorans]|uniref:Uncharacterized protein n=1 Tax=Mycolicibacterium fluoranthenivorans TaxID=258505 RepID=A0A1G4WWZ4_9MYCO|nr:hypothetical protein [Mycolicibacterium fluoranthenivorans]QNJ94809.1 hypothetical protein HZU40_11490 [Mycolicibacterium fluoranthenivorans]SCX31402.1 hypothetical protein SAMN02799620_05327 [Mycolicibacterium fluoranthenivorans]